jgi:hypothetical protein
MKSQFPNSAIRMEFSNSKPEDFSPEIRAWRAYQVEEVKKVLSKRSYLEQANRRAEILDTLWTQEAADTASYGRNWGYYVGLDNIRKYYVDNNPFGSDGTDICHPFTTYKIIIADDNKTAQVTWYSIGYEINPANSPEIDCYWDNQRCGADLRLENGEWKIWHYFAGTDFALRPGFPYATLKTEEETPCSKYLAQEFGTPTEQFQAYTSFYNYFFYPEITMEHGTFTDAISNGPEGNPNYKG